ncbi:MAG: aminopeptidase, partial [Gammaproteobacteria bacterium]
RDLALPVGGRFSAYVDLGRPYVVWNVVSAPRLSIEPQMWCHPLVGCAPYRGYFSLAAARASADRLRAADQDVHVAGVPAYSTLGWFDDPLQSSFIDWPEDDFAELVLHELAHGVVWVPDDVGFNESWATFVGVMGAARWRAARSAATDVASAPPRPAGDPWPALVTLLTVTRAELARVYARQAPAAERLAARDQVLDAARACYADRRGELGAGRYDRLMASLNNAVLATIATYEDHVPAFAWLYSITPGHWAALHARVRALAALPSDVRQTELARFAARARAEAHLDCGRGACAGRADALREISQSAWAQCLRAKRVGMRQSRRADETGAGWQVSTGTISRPRAPMRAGTASPSLPGSAPTSN